MSKFFMLECYGPEEHERAGIQMVHDLGGLNWMLGSRFPHMLPTPIRITLDHDRGIMMPVFKKGILLFSDDLLAAVTEIGIDNLDCYDVELTNPMTNECFRSYKAVNVIGVVSIADLDRSQIQAHGRPRVDVDFDSLSIDESRAHGLLLFRMAECVSGIAVHEKVKKHVQRCGIEHIDWVEPTNWVG